LKTHLQQKPESKKFRLFAFEVVSSAYHINVEIPFNSSDIEYAVMLRHKASANDETDSSCLRMTKVFQKDVTKCGTEAK